MGKFVSNLEPFLSLFAQMLFSLVDSVGNALAVVNASKYRFSFFILWPKVVLPFTLMNDEHVYLDLPT